MNITITKKEAKAIIKGLCAAATSDGRQRPFSITHRDVDDFIKLGNKLLKEYEKTYGTK